MIKPRLLLVLPFLSLFACQANKDPHAEYARVMENMATQNSYHVNGNGQLSMDIPINPDNPDSTIGLTIPFTTDIAITDISQSMNMDLTMDLTVLGQTIDYGFYIRDQYVYLEVMDQKGSVPLDSTFKSMINTTFTHHHETSIDDDLPITLSNQANTSVFTITMDNAYFQSKFNELKESLGEANVNFDGIENVEFTQTITVENQLIQTNTFNGNITMTGFPIDISLSLTYDGYNQTDVIPITPSDYPIQSDGSIDTTFSFDQMV